MPDNHAAPERTVLYGDQCPLYRREIALYRGLPAVVDLRCGLTREKLMTRFQVRQADGHVLSGAAAFVALWRVMPAWRWLARLSQLPGAVWLLERAYRLLLNLRPALQSWARRLERSPKRGRACSALGMGLPPRLESEVAWPRRTAGRAGRCT